MSLEAPKFEFTPQSDQEISVAENETNQIDPIWLDEAKRRVAEKEAGIDPEAIKRSRRRWRIGLASAGTVALLALSWWYFEPGADYSQQEPTPIPTPELTETPQPTASPANFVLAIPTFPEFKIPSLISTPLAIPTLRPIPTLPRIQSTPRPLPTLPSLPTLAALPTSEPLPQPDQSNEEPTPISLPPPQPQTIIISQPPQIIEVMITPTPVPPTAEPTPSPIPPVDLSQLSTPGCLFPNSDGASAEVGNIPAGYVRAIIANNPDFKIGYDEETGLNNEAADKDISENQGKINLSDFIEKVLKDDGSTEDTPMHFNPQQQYYLMLQQAAYPNGYDGPRILIYDRCEDPTPTPEPTSVQEAIATVIATVAVAPSPTPISDRNLELHKIDKGHPVDNNSIAIGAVNCQTNLKTLLDYSIWVRLNGIGANLPSFGPTEIDKLSSIVLKNPDQIEPAEYSALARIYEQTHPNMNTYVCK